jgi:hypothetical protein
MRGFKKRLEKAAEAAGVTAQAKMSAVNAERAVLFRTRLEGSGVWYEAGGHVLYLLNWDRRRKAFCAMLSAQDQKMSDSVMKTLVHCLNHDQFMLDANHPLLEYYLWNAAYIAQSEKPFRPLAMPVELCRWLEGLKPEEYLHYRPLDWCYECGYRYPAIKYGLSHDIGKFLLTRYSKEQIEAMKAPFRGKSCMVCSGEIVSHRGINSDASIYRTEHLKLWTGSPAHSLCEAKREEWIKEIDSVELPEAFNHGYLDEEACRKASEEDFFERRANQNSRVRVEHWPSVEEVVHLC